MKTLKEHTVKALVVCVALTILCGVVYPLAVTGICQLAFPKQANGSIIEIDGKKYGSALLAQEFTGDEYLWGRVMVLNTGAFHDDDGSSLLYAGPSNKSPASAEYGRMIAERVEKIRAAHPERADEPIPVDLVTGSGSGLDPHISPAAAEYQVERVARARGVTADEVRAVIAEYTGGRLLGVFGEPTVNVLEVNLALDGILK